MNKTQNSDFIKQLGQKRLTLNWAQERLKFLKDAQTSMGHALTGMPGGSKNPDKMGSLAADIDETEEHIAQLKQEIGGMISQAMTAIDGISNLRTQQVLCERYVLGKSFQSIAESLDISLPSVYRLHRQGIKQLN